jgi:hypothetical protein
MVAFLIQSRIQSGPNYFFSLDYEPQLLERRLFSSYILHGRDHLVYNFVCTGTGMAMVECVSLPYFMQLPIQVNFWLSLDF